MRKLSLFLASLLICVLAYSQDMSVKSFELDEESVMANIKGNIVYDQNGGKCALIRVITSQTGFSFDVGVLGVQEVRQKTGEVWVYVPKGVKKISISHKNLGLIKDYPLPVQIEAAKTYLLRLDTVDRSLDQFDTDNQVNVSITVTPSNSSISLNGMAIEAKNGVASHKLAYGEYVLEVKCADYHTYKEKLVVKSDTRTVNVNLKPAFGEVAINGSAFKVTIDGYACSDNLYRVAPGKHTLVVANNRYQSYTTSFTVEEGKYYDFSKIVLDPLFKTCTLKSEDPQATLYIRNTTTNVESNLGIGSWTGSVDYGSYELKCSRDNCTSKAVSVVVSKDSPTTFTVTPDFRTISISSLSRDAELYLDGRHVGRGSWSGTVMDGAYAVSCKMDRHYDQEYSITVGNGSAAFQLPEMKPITGTLNVTSYPVGALVYVDGECLGKTPFSKEVIIGQKKVRIDHVGYMSDGQDVTVEENQTSSVDKTLQLGTQVFFMPNKSQGVVSVNGVELGETGQAHPYWVEPGKKEITVVPGDGRVKTYSASRDIPAKGGQLKIKQKYTSKENWNNFTGFLGDCGEFALDCGAFALDCLGETFLFVNDHSEFSLLLGVDVVPESLHPKDSSSFVALGVCHTIYLGEQDFYGGLRSEVSIGYSGPYWKKRADIGLSFRWPSLIQGDFDHYSNIICAYGCDWVELNHIPFVEVKYTHQFEFLGLYFGMNFPTVEPHFPDCDPYFSFGLIASFGSYYWN